MRYREVKKGMEVIIYRTILTRGKNFVGKKGKVAQIHPEYFDLPILIRLKGRNGSLSFSHKELREVK